MAEASPLSPLEARCRRDGHGTDDDTLAAQLRLHLHRGIGYLFADRRIQRIGDLFKRLPLGDVVERAGVS